MTKTQRETLTAIKTYTEEHGYPPSFRELAQILRIGLSSVHSRIHSCCTAGYLESEAPPGSPRAMRIIGTTVGIPEIDGLRRDTDDPDAIIPD